LWLNNRSPAAPGVLELCVDDGGFVVEPVLVVGVVGLGLVLVAGVLKASALQL
jgi:hypothetical protein